MECKVTFIMPAYNPGELIRESIGSILAQSVGAWKLIVVDDGSTDSTVSIAQEYARADKRISVLSNGKGSGSAFQPRKTGIEAADTEFVAPLDSDDLIDPDYLQRLLSLQRSVDADIVYPTMYSMSDIGVRRLAPSDDSLLNKCLPGRDVMKYTIDGWRINCNGGIIRKSLYMEAFSKFGDSTTLTFADELLSRHLLFLARRVAISGARYLYRYNPDSITHVASGKLFHLLENRIALIDFTREMFGQESEEYLLAQRENFHGIFDAARLLEKYDFDREASLYARRMIACCKDKCDRRLLRRSVSPVYYHLLFTSPLSLRCASGLLNFVKRFRKNKSADDSES